MTPNPWQVGSIQEFYFLKCPECTFDTKEESQFQEHAVENHPLSFALFGKSEKSEINHVEEKIENDNFDGNEYDDYGGNEYYDDSADIGNTLEEWKQDGEETYDETKQHQCLACGKTFIARSKLKLHIETVHEGKKPYACSACTYRSGDKGNVKKHVAKQHGENAEVLFLGSDKYSCTICEFTSGLKGELSKHIREVHDGKQNWICKLCDVQFTRKSNLQEHVRQVHEGRKRVFGPKKKSPTKKSASVIPFDNHNTYSNNGMNIQPSDVETHILENIKSEVIQNDESYMDNSYYEPEITTNEEAMNYDPDFHQVAKNVKQEININYAEMDPNNTVCPLCGSKLKSKYYLKYHIQEVHEGIKPYSCSMCDKRFAQRNKLKDHISNIHERIKPFKCSACDYKAGLKGNLTKHIDKVHEGNAEIIYDEEKRYKCTICDFSVSWRPDLRKHIDEVHEGKQDWICEICNIHFARKQNLSSHIATVHEGKRKYSCNLCGAGFMRSIALTEHFTKVHEGKKEFTCLICGADYQEEIHLQKHIAAVHENGGNSQEIFTPEGVDEDGKDPLTVAQDFQNFKSEESKTHWCDRCNARFAKKADLKYHFYSVHSGHKPHMCAFCGHSFEFNNKLQIHIETVHQTFNKGKMSIKCTECEYTCINPANMKNHITVVHDGIKPHQCELCDFSCASKSSLKKHVEAVHEKPKEDLEKAPLMPFLFGGINHAKPIVNPPILDISRLSE